MNLGKQDMRGKGEAQLRGQARSQVQLGNEGSGRWGIRPNFQMDQISKFYEGKDHLICPAFNRPGFESTSLFSSFGNLEIWSASSLPSAVAMLREISSAEKRTDRRPAVDGYHGRESIVARSATATTEKGSAYLGGRHRRRACGGYPGTPFMKSGLLIGIFLVGLGLSGLSAQTQTTYLWWGAKSGATVGTGGDINSNFWKNTSNSALGVTPGAYDIGEIINAPSDSQRTLQKLFIGLNLSAASPFTLTAVNGVDLQQLGALQIDSTRSEGLWVGNDNTGTPGSSALVLNGATIGGVSNVAIDVQDNPDSTIGLTPALVFTDDVGKDSASNTFALRLGTPALAGNNAFVIEAAAPTVATNLQSIKFMTSIGETVAGSSINFLGGGTGTTAGAYMEMSSSVHATNVTTPGTINTYTGGTVLGNSNQTSLADANGVILKMDSAGDLPSSGDVTVNNGSTLWLSGLNKTTYGVSGQTLYLNGDGSLNTGKVIPVNVDSSFKGSLGSLLVDIGGARNLVVTFAGNIELESDSTIAVTGQTMAGDSFTVSGLIGGEGKLTKTGKSIVYLTSANTYSGGTEIKTGTIEAGNNSALGNASSHVQVDSGANLNVDAGVHLTQTNIGLGYDGSYIKNYNAGESLAGSMSVQSVNGLKASIGAGQAGTSPATLTASFDTAAQTGTVTGEVANVSGFAATMTSYVLELTLSPSMIDGNAQISTFNSTSGAWVAAVGGNTGNASGSGFFDESYATFAAANDITDANLANFLGDYGTDAVTGQTWAILNYDGHFSITDAAAVPEPATWAYISIGLGLLCWWQRIVRRGSGNFSRTT